MNKTQNKIIIGFFFLMSIYFSYKWRDEAKTSEARQKAFDSTNAIQGIEIAKYTQETQSLRDSLLKVIYDRDLVKAQIKEVKENYYKYYKLYVEITTHRDSVQFSNTRNLLTKHRQLKLDRSK